MYCKNCGKECDDNAVICVHCGCMTGKNPANATVEEDAPSTAYSVIGFFIPIVGLILYLINMNTAPLKAKSAGKGALIGVIVSVVCGIIYGALMGSLIGSML